MSGGTDEQVFSRQTCHVDLFRIYEEGLEFRNDCVTRQMIQQSRRVGNKDPFSERFSLIISKTSAGRQSQKPNGVH
jgi:hypothetical protein